jgi:hypothetical protein
MRKAEVVMKTTFAVLLLVVLASCASSANDAASSGIEVNLTQVGGSASDLFYMRGPISLQYQLQVTNHTNQPLTLRRLDLSSVGLGAYAIRTGSTPFNERIAANGTTTLHLAAWGTARGGRLTVNEPVTMRIIAQFQDASGRTFNNISTENLSQF